MGPLQATGCSQDELREIWELAGKTAVRNEASVHLKSLLDIDKDGCLDSDEFAVAMYLCHYVRGGEKIPGALPAQMVPPSKKEFMLTIE